METKVVNSVDNLEDAVVNLHKEFEDVKKGKLPTTAQITKYKGIKEGIDATEKSILAHLKPGTDSRKESLTRMDEIIKPSFEEIKKHMEKHIGGRKHKTRKARKQLKKNKTRKS